MTLINVLGILPELFYTQIEVRSIAFITTESLQINIIFPATCHARVTVRIMLPWSPFGVILNANGFVESTLDPMRKPKQLYLSMFTYFIIGRDPMRQ